MWKNITNVFSLFIEVRKCVSEIDCGVGGGGRGGGGGGRGESRVDLPLRRWQVVKGRGEGGEGRGWNKIYVPTIGRVSKGNLTRNMGVRIIR